MAPCPPNQISVSPELTEDELLIERYIERKMDEGTSPCDSQMDSLLKKLRRENFDLLIEDYESFNVLLDEQQQRLDNQLAIQYHDEGLVADQIGIFLLPFGDQRKIRKQTHDICKTVEKCFRTCAKFKKEMAEPLTPTLYLRLRRMKCQRLALESKNVVFEIYKDYKVGIKKLGVAIQHCNSVSNRTVPPLLRQQYRSFKMSMERSANFVDDALAAAAQVTVMEHQLCEKLGIPLEFNY